MSTIANLDIALRGSTASLDKALAKAGKGFNALADTAHAAMNSIFPGLGTLMGVVGKGMDFIGGAIGAVSEHVREGFGEIATAAKGMGEGVGEGGDEAAQSLATVGEEGKGFAASLLDAWQPVWQSMSAGFHAVAEQVTRFLAPVFKWLKGFVEGLAFVVQAVFQVIVDAVKPLWDWIKRLVDKWAEWTEKWPDAGETAIDVCQKIAVALSYVFDGVKALAGAAEWTMGKVRENLEAPFLRMCKTIVLQFRRACESSSKNGVNMAMTIVGALAVIVPFATQAAKALRNVVPKDFDLAKELDDLAKKAEESGKKMQQQGQNLMDSFGASKDKVNEFFADLKEKWKNRKKDEDKPAAQLTSKTALKGSDEAFKIIHGVQGDKMYKVANKQLAVQRQMAKELAKKRRNRPILVSAGSL